MQKLFKRSLAMVLSIMMVVTMFSGMTFAAETLEPYTSYMNEEWSHLWHLAADNFSSDEEDSNWHNFYKVAQEFVPEKDVVTGVKLGMILTGGNAVVHVEIRKGDVNSEAIYATDVPVNSRGNLNAMYEIGFDQEVAVTPGEVYYVAFWFTTRTAGNIAIVCGGTANGHSVYNYHVQDGGETTFAKTGSAVNFEIISTPGVNKLVHHVDTASDITFHTGSYTGRGIDTEIKTEGVSSTFGWWNAGNAVEIGTTSKTNTSFRIPQGGIDFSKAKYFAMDIYKSGFEVDVFTGIGFGTEASWSSRDLYNYTDDAVTQQILNMKDGWNTIVVELGDTSAWANVQNIWLAFDNDAAIRFTAENPVIGYDNFRIMDEKGYTYWENQEAITAVEEKIAALPATDALTEDHVDAVTEVKTAFDALDASAQALVWNADVLAAAVAKIAEFGPLDINAGRIIWHDFVNNGENHALTNINEAYWVTAEQAPSGQKSIAGKLNADAGGASIFHMAPSNAVDASNAAYVAFDVYVDKEIPASALADAGVNIGDGSSWDNWGKVTDSFASTIRSNGGLKEGWNLFVLPVYNWAENAHKAEVKNGRVYVVLNTADYKGTKISVNDLVFYTEAGYETAIERNKAKAATLAIWDIPAVDTLTLDDKATVDAAATAYAAVLEECQVLVKGVDTLTAAQAKIAELENDQPKAPVVDGEKDEAYSDAKSMTVTKAYAGVGAADTDNTTQATIKTYYTWDDDYNYIYMEVSEPGYAYTGQNADVIYYLNNGTAGGYFFQCAGGGYVQWTIAGGVGSATSDGSNLAPAEKAGYIDGATGQTRRYEIKFDRDPNAEGFFVSPVVYGSASYVVAYHAFYSTNGHFVKYEDESTWSYTDVPQENLTDIQVWDMDTMNPGSTGWGDSVSTKLFTEGTGSRGVNFAGAQNKDFILYGTNDNNSNSATEPATTDISGAIDADGKTVMTLDLYVTDADQFDTGSQRVVFGLICATSKAMSEGIGKKNAWMEINTQNGKNAKWTEDFDLGEAGLQNGWNHLAITMDTDEGENKYAHTTNTRADYWDATKFWQLRVLVNSVAANNSDFYIDDVHFMTPAAYAATKESTLAVKDVIIAINELPADATASSEEVLAIKEAYAALSAEQQAKVTNYSVIENMPEVVEPLDLQLHAMDKIDMQIIAGGNQGTNGVQGTITTDNYVEGTGAHFSNWTGTKVGDINKMYLSLTNLPNVDFSVADYLAFDIYVNDVTPKWVNGTNDINLQLGSEANWPSSDLMTYGNSNFAKYVNDLKLGEWNHVVIPLDTNAKNVKNLKMYWENAVTITGENPYVLFDDFRLLDELGLAIDEERTIAKAVVAQIATLNTADAVAVAAATEAYNALTDAQKAYVTNVSVLEEANQAPADAQVVIDAINNIAGGNAIMFHDAEKLDYFMNFSTPANIALAEGEGNNGGNAVKVAQTKDGTQEHNIGVRVPENAGISGAGIAAVQFDLYLSEGLSFNEGGWGNMSLQNAHVTGGDANLAGAQANVKIAMKDYLANCQAGWNTVTIPVDPDDAETIKQICFRFYSNFTGATGTYLMMDNVKLVYAVNEITYADNALIDSVKAQYDALTDAAKALVTNIDVLNGYLAAMDAEEAAAADVVNAINALPPVSSDDPEADVIGLEDEAAVNAAEAALAALAADTKAALVPAEVEAALTAARARIDEIKENSDIGQLVAPVVSAIDALPAVEDVRTSDEAAINSANELYNGLSDEAKTYLAENFADQAAKLTAVTAELAVEKEHEAAAKAVVDAIAALPVPATAADEEAVNTVKAQYDALAADVQNYVTNKAVLEAAVAAVAADKADIEAAAAVSAAIAALPAAKQLTEADVEAVKNANAAYEALTANGKAKLTEAEVATLITAVATVSQFEAVDVQFRAFEASSSDLNKAGAAAGDKYGLTKDQPLEGTSALQMKWTGDASGEFHVFVYHHRQGDNWTVDSYDEGSWKVPCAKASKGTLNLVFDMYVSDPAAIRNATGDCGFGFDADVANAWGGGGQGGGANKAELMNAFDAANNGAGLKPGWNHVVLPLGMNKNYGGTIMTIYDMRFYFLGATIPSGFTLKFDDIRFMNAIALETVLPARTAAKEVTKAIYALAEDFTYEDGKAVVALYNKVAADYKDVVIGYDDFYATYVEKYADQIAAELAADIAAAQPVVDQIAALTKDETMFNDCESLNVEGLEVVANLNSGADDKALAEGQGVDGGNAAKFIKKAAGKSEFNEVFRVTEAVDFKNAKTLEFDLYIAEGMTIEPGWSPVYIQTGHSNDNDTNKLASIDMKDMMGNWKAGQWNHVVVSLDSIPKMLRTGLAQVSIRLYNTLSGEAGDYIMIDNLILAGTKTITLEDQEAIEAAEAAYAALTDNQKALVSNYDALTAARADLDVLLAEAAVAEVEELIAALPETITVDDQAAVEAAEAAYAELDEALKTEVDAAAVEKLAAARVALDAALKAAADAKAAADVDALIEAFPETVTPADAEQVNAANDAFNALTEEQKALVKAENKAALAAALEAIVAPEYKLGDIDGDGKISAADALEVLKSVVGKITLTDTQKLAGDVDKDGDVDATDALEILKEVVGKDNCF